MSFTCYGLRAVATAAINWTYLQQLLSAFPTDIFRRRVWRLTSDRLGRHVVRMQIVFAALSYVVVTDFILVL
jgi:hypothetical protein